MPKGRRPLNPAKGQRALGFHEFFKMRGHTTSHLKKLVSKGPGLLWGS